MVRWNVFGVVLYFPHSRHSAKICWTDSRLSWPHSGSPLDCFLWQHQTGVCGVSSHPGLSIRMAENCRLLPISLGSNFMTPIFIMSPPITADHLLYLKNIGSFITPPSFAYAIFSAHDRSPVWDLLLGSSSISSSCETFPDILLQRHGATAFCI